MAQYDVDLRDYWLIIRKRKTYIILLVIIVGICSLGFAKFKEPVPLYEAIAAIKIDRSANIGSILTGAYWNQAENMDTHVYIIKSFPVLAIAGQLMGKIPKDLTLDDIRTNKTAPLCDSTTEGHRGGGTLRKVPILLISWLPQKMLTNQQRQMPMGLRAPIEITISRRKIKKHTRPRHSSRNSCV